MNHTISYIKVLLVFSSLLFAALITNTVYAQQLTPGRTEPPPLPSLPPSKSYSIKIASPTFGQQVTVGKNLTISGTISMTNITSGNKNNNCQILVGVNHVKPYQRAIATGPRGANDYSKWTFMLTPKYTTIKYGPDNKITAAYSCINNPALKYYSSVNVTGIVSIVGDTSKQTPPPQQQKNATARSNATTTITMSSIANTSYQKVPQPVSNSTIIENSTGVSLSSPLAPSPTKSVSSDTLLYLGYHDNKPSSSSGGSGHSSIHHILTAHSSDGSKDITTTQPRIHHHNIVKSTHTTINKINNEIRSRVLNSFNNQFRLDSSNGVRYHIFPF